MSNEQSTPAVERVRQVSVWVLGALLLVSAAGLVVLSVQGGPGEVR